MRQRAILYDFVDPSFTCCYLCDRRKLAHTIRLKDWETPMASRGSAASQALLNAVRRLMRPMAKALIEAGITFPAFADLAREAYVNAAFDDFPIDGRTPTISRVMVLTGIHRREVTRLAKRDRVMVGTPPSLSLGARVIAKWCSNATYLDAQRQPLPLPRSAPSGQPSFNGLVASVSKDIRPKILLDEWLHQGLVVMEEKQIRLHTAAFVPREDYEEKAYYFGRNLRDHIAVSAHNLAGHHPPLIDRAVYEDSLSAESLKDLRVFCERRGSDLLLEVYQEVRRLAERDREQGVPDRRMTFGVYLFSDEATGDTNSSQTGSENDVP